MTDPDEPVLRGLALTDTVPDDVWTRALSVAFDPDAHAADASVVPTMDDAGDLPDTADDSDVGIVHHAGHDDGAHEGHDAIDLGGHEHDGVHDDETHHDTGAHDIDHGHDDGPGHDPHDSGWHV
ncbi:hypothetical protein [Williamsia deligens]|uniref:Uncharacterized protein n=1 Tax=Williamsia deligens TaxID=321325 RepID=A0ABW3G6C5_9NOCA|nr:hypothetical protein [Williamsia deligens]MCP2193428.1 hypothetical protein [Williamsia deligens]